MDMPQNNDTPRVGRDLSVRGGIALGIAVGALVVMSQAHFIVARIPNVAAVISSVLVELTNADRGAQGLGTLTVSPVLTAVAEAKAKDMAAKGYFAHTSPEGLTPWHWFKEKGYKFSYAGENLAVDFNESIDVERAWMNSPTHRANLVGTQFTEIGIATAQGTYQGRSTTFVVQVFGTPSVPEAVVPVKRVVRDVVVTPAPEAPALATTLPTTTPVTATIVLGESAGAYLASSAQPPRWYRIFRYFF
jgi:hypothetical protein